MLTINPTAEAPTIDQRTAQLIRQFNGVTGNLAQILATGIPAQPQVVNPKGVIVRPAFDAITAQELSDSLDRVIGTESRQAIVNALAALSGGTQTAPVAPAPAPAQ